MSERLLRIEEVAGVTGSSVQTLNNWYRWRNLHPDSEYAKLLPDYVQEGNRQIRLWKRDDLWKLIEFKKAIPHGRNGILGDITQKNARKNKQTPTCNI